MAAASSSLGACSSCDATTTATGQPAPSSSASPAPVAPAVTLVPTVTSKAVSPWPEQTQALSAKQVAALLPQEEGARIQLHDAGLEPRAVRRHQLKVGAKKSLRLELDLGMKIHQGGETTIPPVPALEVEVALETLAVEGEEARVQLEISKAEIRSRGEEDADVVEQMGPLVKKLPGIRAELRVTAQGIRARSPAPPKGTPQELLQLWSSVGEAVSDAIVAFPAEAIGAGAQWTVLDRQKRAGVVMLRKTVMTLLDVSGQDLRVSGQVVEAAIGGSAQDPALPKEIQLEVLEGVTVGKRRHALRGGELWPLSSLTELSSDLVLKASATAGHFTDTKTSKIKLTQILRTVRTDAADPEGSHVAPENELP